MSKFVRLFRDGYGRIGYPNAKGALCSKDDLYKEGNSVETYATTTNRNFEIVQYRDAKKERERYQKTFTNSGTFKDSRDVLWISATTAILYSTVQFAQYLHNHWRRTSAILGTLHHDIRFSVLPISSNSCPVLALKDDETRDIYNNAGILRNDTQRSLLEAESASRTRSRRISSDSANHSASSSSADDSTSFGPISIYVKNSGKSVVSNISIVPPVAHTVGIGANSTVGKVDGSSQTTTLHYESSDKDGGHVGQQSCFASTVIEFEGSLLNVTGLELLKDGLHHEAFQYFNKAAEMGYAKAQYNLGLCYHKGYGVKPSLNKAIEMWKVASQQNHGMANYQLGILTSSGIISASNKHEIATDYFRKAATANVPQANECLKLLNEPPTCV